MDAFISLALCILIADFLSGVLHWAEDTYAVPTKSRFWNDNIVYPNIEHHRNPGHIVRGTYWENSVVTTSLAVVFMIGLLLLHIYNWQPYFTAILAAQFNQTHAWAHTKKVPRWVAKLQEIGLIQSVDHHIVHHQKPYMIRYCTGTNLLNPILDKINFWRFLESLIPAEVKRGSKERDYL